MWTRIKAWFSDSETIFYALLQMALGILATIVTYVEPSVLAPIMPEGFQPLWLVAHGLGLEWLRRRRDPEMGQ